MIGVPIGDETLPPITQGDKTQWLYYCNAAALRNLEADRLMVTAGLLDVGAFERQEKYVRDCVASRAYYYGRPGSEQWWDNEETRHDLFWLCIRRINPKFTRGQMDSLIKKVGALAACQAWNAANANPSQSPASAGDSEKTNPIPTPSSGAGSFESEGSPTPKSMP